jgi:hypothetical protein
MVNPILHGVDRDQLTARHRANHISIAYAPDASSADNALAVKAAMFHAMKFKVHLCGEPIRQNIDPVKNNVVPGIC